jgi:hypothetical protein
MTSYRLSKLASGSYDVLLNGMIIASLARNGQDSSATWSAELLVDLACEERPAPFTKLEHQFATFGDACRWLGDPVVHGECQE